MTYEEPKASIEAPHIYEDRIINYTYIGSIEWDPPLHLYNTDDGHTTGLERILQRKEEYQVD